MAECRAEVEEEQMGIGTTPSTGTSGAVRRASGEDLIFGRDTKQEKYGLAPLSDDQKEAVNILIEMFSGMDGVGMALDSACFQRYLR